MWTTSAFLLPSLPTMLIDEQRGDYTETLETLTAVGERIVGEGPDAIVAVSSRWVSTGPFAADDAREHRSVVDLPGFGVEPRHDCPGHPAVARAIVEEAVRAGVRAATVQHGLDSGVSVPLHFVDRERRVPVVPVSISDGTPDEHRAWGEAIRRAGAARPERLTFVAGGALSWNVHAFNLRREVPEALDLDALVFDAVRRGAWSALHTLPDAVVERGQPEAGLRHLEVLRGFLVIDAPGRVLAHEQLPGVGAALIELAL